MDFYLNSTRLEYT